MTGRKPGRPPVEKALKLRPTSIALNQRQRETLLRIGPDRVRQFLDAAAQHLGLK